MASKFLSRFKIGAGINSRRAYRAYHAKEYKAMLSSLRDIKSSYFISNKEEDMTILHHAAFSGDLEGIDYLQELPYFDDIVNDNTNVYEWTPVLWAVNKKHFEMVKKLVRLGANPLKPKKDGITGLHIAATNNDVHILDYLLSKMQSNINIPNEEGWTPAHFAAFMGNYDSLSLLIEHGGDLWFKNNQKMNIFEEIVRSNDENLLNGVYKLYISKPRDVTQEGSYSLLHLAAGCDSFKVLNYL